MAAATSLSSSSTFVETRTVSQPAAASPQCVSLPTLPPPTPVHPQSRVAKATAYCRKIARNVSMATTGDAPVILIEEAPPAPPAEVSETTEFPDMLKTIQGAWDKVEDKYAVSSLGLAALVALCGSAGMISAIDKLPLIPGALELVGIGYSGWFAYRNLVFTPDSCTWMRKAMYYDTGKIIIDGLNVRTATNIYEPIGVLETVQPSSLEAKRLGLIPVEVKPQRLNNRRIKQILPFSVTQASVEPRTSFSSRVSTMAPSKLLARERHIEESHLLNPMNPNTALESHGLRGKYPIKTDFLTNLIRLLPTYTSFKEDQDGRVMHYNQVFKCIQKVLVARSLDIPGNSVEIGNNHLPEIPKQRIFTTPNENEVNHLLTPCWCHHHVTYGRGATHLQILLELGQP
ncbi:hypothetical protein V2J09_008494 [Rumex salicifolius]